MPEKFEGVSPPQESKEAESQSLLDTAISKAGEIVNRHLNNPNGVSDFERRMLVKPTNREGLFKITPEATLNLVEGMADVLSEHMGREKFLELAKWIASMESGTDGLEEAVKLCESENEKDIRSGIHKLVELYERSRYRDFDQDGHEMYTGDVWSNRQILHAAQAATGKEDPVDAIKNIANASITNGSQGTYIRTGANRKLLELALGKEE